MWTQLLGEKRIALDDENLQYTGRIDFADPQNPVFLFTASFVRFRMTGHHLRVVLTNTHHLWENRLGVVINGEQFGVLLDWDALNVIDLSDHLRDGENDVMLFKRQDSCYAKMENRDFRVYTLLGDGEIEEGQVWEAAMFAGFRKLDNLCVMVDNNNLQIDGPIDQVCSPYPIDKKFEAFNFHVINADAHDFDAIRAAFKEARETKGMPTCIVFHSIKGKGVSFMENSVDWHGKAPNDEEYAIAMADLDKIEKELEKAGEQ